MNEKISSFIKNSKRYLSKHSPEILTGLGIGGMLTTVVLAVTATPKALVLIEEEKERVKNELTPIETVKVAWKPYIPAFLTGAGSIICIVGASSIKNKRSAALAAAYSLSERTLTRYRDKVVETLGEKKEKNIRDEIAQEQLNANPVSSNQVIITSDNTSLCYDAISGRYFKTNMDRINKAINKLNRDLTYEHYVSLNDLYYELGLKGIKSGSVMGWNLDDGLIQICISTCLSENEEPCLVLDYMIRPKHDFDKIL